MLTVVEDAAGDLKEADAAEMRLIEEIRRMGHEAMQACANRQVETQPLTPTLCSALSVPLSPFPGRGERRCGTRANLTYLEIFRK